MTVLFLVLAVLWVCCSCFVGKCKCRTTLKLNPSLYEQLLQAISFICCLLCIAIPALVICGTVFVFNLPPNYQQARQNSDSTTMCQFLEVPAVTVVASYLFIALLCLSVTVSCCYICKQKRNHNIPVCHCDTRMLINV